MAQSGSQSGPQSGFQSGPQSRSQSGSQSGPVWLSLAQSGSQSGLSRSPSKFWSMPLWGKFFSTWSGVSKYPDTASHVSGFSDVLPLKFRKKQSTVWK